MVNDKKRREGSTGSSGAETLPPGPYRIALVAELSGVPPATLRAWERRYGIPTPERTASAYRLYSAADVLRVRRMRELTEGGMGASQAAEIARVATSDPAEAVAPDGLRAARERLLEAATRFDSRELQAELGRLMVALDARTLYDHVVSPLLVEVGRRWRAGELSIASEHLLSERLEHVVRGALTLFEHVEGPVVLLACVQGEQHVLGLLGAALTISTWGARLVILGANTPPDALGEAIASMKPALIGLAATTMPAIPGPLFRSYGRACGDTPWIVGGDAASSLEVEVTKAGGIIAPPDSDRWHSVVRGWIRDAARPGTNAVHARARQGSAR